MSMDLGAFVDFLADCSFKMPKFFPRFSSLLFQMVEFILEPPSSSIYLTSTFSSPSFCGKQSDLLIVMNTSGPCWLFTAYVLSECPQPCISKFLGALVKVLSSRESLMDLSMVFSMLHIGILFSTPKSFTFYLFWFQFNAVINMPHTAVFPFISCVNLQTVTTRKIIVASGKAKGSYLHNNCLIGRLTKQSSATSGFLNVQ